MVAMRKYSSRWGVVIAAALLGVFGGYALVGNQPAQAQFGNSPIAILQQQVKELQTSQKDQDAFLIDLDERIVILEKLAIGGGVALRRIGGSRRSRACGLWGGSGEIPLCGTWPSNPLL